MSGTARMTPPPEDGPLDVHAKLDALKRVFEARWKEEDAWRARVDTSLDVMRQRQVEQRWEIGVLHAKSVLGSALRSSAPAWIVCVLLLGILVALSKIAFAR